jgi:hypothetical protein
MKSIKSSWTKVVNASTVPLKDTAWREFKNKHGQVYRPVVDYIEDEWLRYSTARHFLHCFTDQVLHFGNSITSRAEDAHWVLKRDLQVISNNDLLSCIRSFEKTAREQHRTLKDKLDDARIQRPTKLLILLYHDVIGKVSPHALYKVHAIYERYLPVRNHTKPPIPDSCTGVTTATMGIPCIHVIKQRYDTERSLDMRDFHRHWHIRRELEDEHSPPRDPSQFEIIEQASTQTSSTAWHQQGVKRRCIGYVGESRASSPEPPEPQPLEELIAKAMQPERTESVQGRESSELKEVSPEQ